MPCNTKIAGPGESGDENTSTDAGDPDLSLGRPVLQPHLRPRDVQFIEGKMCWNAFNQPLNFGGRVAQSDSLTGWLFFQCLEVMSCIAHGLFPIAGQLCLNGSNGVL